MSRPHSNGRRLSGFRRCSSVGAARLPESSDVLTALLAARRVPHGPRTALALFCGLLAGVITIQKNLREPTPRDFEQAWYAARAILAGSNPYQQVGPGLAVDWPFPLLYPLTAGVVAIPFAPFSVHASAVLFSFIGGVLFAWALMEHGYGPLFGFFSMPLRAAFESVQWSPALASATVIAPLGLFLVAKPTVGAAIFLARPSRWAIVGAAVFGGIAADVLGEDVHDEVAVVHQDPAPGGGPLDQQRLDLHLRLEALLDRVGDRRRLPLAAGGAENEVIRDRRQVADGEDVEVAGFFVDCRRHCQAYTAFYGVAHV